MRSCTDVAGPGGQLPAVRPAMRPCSRPLSRPPAAAAVHMLASTRAKTVPCPGWMGRGQPGAAPPARSHSPALSGPNLGGSSAPCSVLCALTVNRLWHGRQGAVARRTPLSSGQSGSRPPVASNHHHPPSCWKTVELAPPAQFPRAVLAEASCLSRWRRRNHLLIWETTAVIRRSRGRHGERHGLMAGARLCVSHESRPSRLWPRPPKPARVAVRVQAVSVFHAVGSDDEERVPATGKIGPNGAWVLVFLPLAPCHSARKHSARALRRWACALGPRPPPAKTGRPGHRTEPTTERIPPPSRDLGGPPPSTLTNAQHHHRHSTK